MHEPCDRLADAPCSSQQAKLFNYIAAMLAWVGCCVPCLAQVAARTLSETGWKVVWSDEFNQANGLAPDQEKWTAVTGGSGWGNQEREYYTSRPENVHLENGNLVITARMEAYTGRDNVRRPYTSARLQTKGKFEQRDGRFEARSMEPDRVLPM